MTIKQKPPIPNDLVVNFTNALSAWCVEQHGAMPIDHQPPWQKKATYAMVRSALESLTSYDCMLLLDRLETPGEGQDQ